MTFIDIMYMYEYVFILQSLTKICMAALAVVNNEPLKYGVKKYMCLHYNRTTEIKYIDMRFFSRDAHL